LPFYINAILKQKLKCKQTHELIFLIVDNRRLHDLMFASD
jgi:hypothetical protein